MAKRKRNSFARIGVVCVAMIMALGLTGVGYAAWSKAISIIGTVETGTWSGEVAPSDCSDPLVINCYVDPSDPLMLVIELTDAPADSYYCDFTIEDPGTVPVKIQDIQFDLTNLLPEEVTVDEVIENVAEGDQIDPGVVPPISGRVNFSVTVGEGEVASGSFTITFTFVQWNLYVP